MTTPSLLPKPGDVLVLGRCWVIGERMGHPGGFGQVVAAEGDGQLAVAQFVRKEPGAYRELLFADLAGARNVVPVIDRGEHGDYWVLVMPRAARSLRDLLDEAGAVPLDQAQAILADIADALADLAERADPVVHRDIKPENVLQLDGHWCLADFGISRYAEASTATETRKHAMTPYYAAPEQWRLERASGATDVYALGVVAYELIDGTRPFPDGTVDQLRDAHLHDDPARMSGAPAALAALIEECLYKAPEARPRGANFAHRLARHRARSAPGGGLAALEEANRAQAAAQAASEREASQARTASERRAALAQAATASFGRISTAVYEAITEAAPSANARRGRDGSWSISLGAATLTMTAPRVCVANPWGGWEPPAFDVICSGALALRIPTNRYGWEGRSHSMWFGDMQEADDYGWFETAFMVSPLVRTVSASDPFARSPGEAAAKAVWAGMAEFQVAWPFTRLEVGDVDEMVGRWGGWLAAASAGHLSRPSMMPERDPQGSWRRN